MATLEAVRDASDATRAGAEVQAAVQRRIEGYPGKITESHHRAHVVTPVGVASLLEACPSLLPAAVQAFYLRDPIDLKACRSMRFFPPETCVTTCVTFTRTLYAQLVHQRFQPDPLTGWKLPPSGDPGHRAADLGLKLACGFEILACRARPSPEDADLAPSIDDLSDNPRWQRYLQSLHQKHYFRGELTGSELHSELMERARQYYVTHILNEPRTSVPGDLIHQLLAKLRPSAAQWQKRQTKLPPADDDSWLEVGPEELDQLLEAQFQLEPADSAQPGQLGQQLQAFLQQLSGPEGVESQLSGPDGGESQPASRKTSKARKTSRKISAAALRKISTLSQASTASAMSSLSQKIDLNPEHFQDAVRHMLDLGLDDEDWDDGDSSGMSSYGDDEEIVEPALLRQYQGEMDRQLQETTLAESFQRATDAVRKESTGSQATSDVELETEGFRPVDIDVNAVQNLLRSLQEQPDVGGPAATLLASLKNSQTGEQ